MHYEFVVTDPVSGGEVFFDSRVGAIDYADQVDESAFCVVWQDGVEIGRSPLTRRSGDDQ